MDTYGKAPKVVLDYQPIPQWEEYMHYLYLPVGMPGMSKFALPKRLKFAEYLLFAAWRDYGFGTFDKYIYLTVHRGWASPGHSLNRPGWHADGFGTEDVNYVWADRYPTLFAQQEFKDISDSHDDSMKQFTEQIDESKIVTYPDCSYLRLDPYVVHHVPTDIPAPGGNRSFLKVSISEHQYALKGNSHNYLIDYNWEMLDRTAVRNNPATSGRDYA